jgi:hypothetical protein
VTSPTKSLACVTFNEPLPDPLLVLLVIQAAIQILGPALLLVSLAMVLAAMNGSLDRLPKYPILAGVGAPGNGSSQHFGDMDLAAGVLPHLQESLGLAGTRALHGGEGLAGGVVEEMPLEMGGTILEGMGVSSEPRDASPTLDLQATLLRSLSSMLVPASFSAPAALITFATLYLAWFTCTAWTCYTIFFLFVYRNGMHL